MTFAAIVEPQAQAAINLANVPADVTLQGSARAVGYKSASFDRQALAVFEQAENAAKSQSVHAERSANQLLKADALALIADIDDRDAELVKQFRDCARAEMDALARQLDYSDGPAMFADCYGNPQPSVENTPATSPPEPAESSTVTAKGKSPAEPFDSLMKDELTSTGKTDLQYGFYAHAGIKPGSKMAKWFKDKHGIELTKDHFRPATVEERDAMKTQNKVKFDSVKRRVPRTANGGAAKKP